MLYASWFLCAAVVSLVSMPNSAVGHGYLSDPPGRSSLWRFDGYTGVEPNYDDMGLFCGGKETQHNSINQGRCGECGDEWSLPRPRPNDEGGLYGRGVIAQSYFPGQVVRMEVTLTASHLGYFEFRLCADKTSPHELVTQECLDRHLLRLVDGSTRYQVKDFTTMYHWPMVRLPDNVTCDYCVLQWRYNTANSVGNCTDGTSARGCGAQETFVNCADIAVVY